MFFRFFILFLSLQIHAFPCELNNILANIGAYPYSLRPYLKKGTEFKVFNNQTETYHKVISGFEAYRPSSFIPDTINGGGQVYLKNKNGIEIGSLEFQLVKHDIGIEMLVHGIEVLEQFQRQGVSQYLLALAIVHAPKINHITVWKLHQANLKKYREALKLGETKREAMKYTPSFKSLKSIGLNDLFLKERYPLDSLAFSVKIP